MIRAAILGLLTAGMTIGPALGVEVEGNKLILSPSEVDSCRSEGGCMLLSTDYLRHILAQEHAKSCPRSGKMT